MSSCLGEEVEATVYSAPRKGVHPVPGEEGEEGRVGRKGGGSLEGEEPPMVTGMVHSYVNVVEREQEPEEEEEVGSELHPLVDN